MANELNVGLDPVLDTGRNVTGKVRGAGGTQIGSDVSMTEVGSGFYTGDFSLAAVSDGIYFVEFVDDDSDNLLGDGQLSVRDNAEYELHNQNDFDPSGDVVSNVTLVATTTTNTDMRGTDGANTIAPDNTSISAILTDTNELQGNQGDWVTATGFATPTDVTDSETVVTTAIGDLENISVTEVVDGVWDEPLTGSTHNVPASAGRRLRQLANTIVLDGSVVSATSNTIVLDSAASSSDGAYDPSIITITDGTTGGGQSRIILQYDGATKTAVVNRDWKVQPDATSEYVIHAYADLSSVNEGLLQSATSSTATLNALASGDDDTYVGQAVFIVSGGGADQLGLVTSYNGTTKVATLSMPWATIPDNTSGYVMLPNSPVLLGSTTHTGAIIPNVTLVDTTTTNTDMRGNDNANTVAPDNASISAILVDTDELQQNQDDWATATGFAKPTDVTDSEAVITTAIGNLHDISTTEVQAELVTYGANKIAPDNAGINANGVAISNLNDPTVAEIDAELTLSHGAGTWTTGASGGGDATEAKQDQILSDIADVEAKVDIIEGKTSQLNFVGDDVKSTLDGEEVTTDSASRTASKATGYATPTNVTDSETVITDAIGALNDVSEAQVKAQADQALVDYDAATKSELDSAVAPLATEANATANKDEVVAEVNENETKIDNIGTQTTNSDAILSDMMRVDESTGVVVGTVLNVTKGV